MSPVAGVEFLAVQHERIGPRGRIPAMACVGDVRDALLLVDDQVVDDRESSARGLQRQVRGRVAVGAAVVHVHMDIAADPAPPGGHRSRDAPAASPRHPPWRRRRPRRSARTGTRSGPFITSTCTLPAGTSMSAVPSVWKYIASKGCSSRSKSAAWIHAVGGARKRPSRIRHGDAGRRRRCVLIEHLHAQMPVADAGAGTRLTASVRVAPPGKSRMRRSV